MPEVLASELTRAHARELLKLENAELKRLRSYHETARLEILGRLTTLDAGTFTAQQHRVVLAQVTAGIRALERQLGERWSKSLDDNLSTAVDQTLAEVAVWEPQFRGGASAQIRLDALRRVTEQRALLLQQFETSVQRYGLELVGDVQRRLGVHIAQNSSWRDMAIDVAGRLHQHGIAGARWRADRIVRTEMVNVLSAGHDAAIEASAEFIPGLQRQWDSYAELGMPRDSRICPICLGLEGQVRDLGEPFVTKDGRAIQRPGAHPNCRCRVVPYHAEWDEDAPDTAPKPPAPAPKPDFGQRLADAESNLWTRSAQGLETPAQIEAVRRAATAFYQSEGLEGWALARAATQRTVASIREGESRLVAARAAARTEFDKLEKAYLREYVARGGVVPSELRANVESVAARLARMDKEDLAPRLAALEARASEALEIRKTQVADKLTLARQAFVEAHASPGTPDVGTIRSLVEAAGRMERLDGDALEAYVAKAVTAAEKQGAVHRAAVIADLQGQADDAAQAYALTLRSSANLESWEKPREVLVEQLRKLELLKGTAGEAIADLAQKEIKKARIAAVGAVKEQLDASVAVYTEAIKAGAVPEELVAARGAVLERSQHVHLLQGVTPEDAGKLALKAADAAKAAAEEELAQLIAASQPEVWPVATQAGAPERVMLPNGKSAQRVAASSGSNPGGFYATADGETLFLKFPKSVGQVGAEGTSAELARMMGLTTKDYFAFAPDAKHVAIGSPKVTLQKLGAKELAAEPTEALADHFVHAAWTRNWDVVGLEFDNLVKLPNGNLVTVDYGGSLLWRAQGSLKPGGLPAAVDELQSLRAAGTNAQTAKVFGKLTDEDIAAAIQRRLSALDDDEIRAAVSRGKFAAADRETIEKGLLARKQWLAEWAEEKLGGVAGTGTPDQVRKALLGSLPNDPDVAIQFKAGASAKDALSDRYRKAVDGDVESLVKMGRRLWAGTPQLEANQDLALRFLQTARQLDLAALRAELKPWDSMKAVLEALETKGGGQLSLKPVRLEITRIEKKLAAEQAAQAAKAAKEMAEFKAKQAVLKAEIAEKKAAYQVELEAWKAKRAKVLGGLPQKTTKQGKLTVAYEKRVEAWSKRLHRKGGVVREKVGEAQVRLMEIEQELDRRLIQAKGTYSERRVTRRVNAERKAAKLDYANRIESLLEEGGILPVRPTPPKGLEGLPTPREVWTTQVSRDRIHSAAQAAENAAGRDRVATYLQGEYGPERWIDKPDPGVRPFTTSEGLEAIRTFTGGSYRNIRAAKRGRLGYVRGQNSFPENALAHYKQTADDIDEMLARLPGFETSDQVPVVTRRETFLSAKDRESFVNDVLTPGKHVVFKAPSSASTAQNAWSGELVYRIRGRMSGTPIRGISQHPGEQEILFPSGATFEVESWTRTGQGFEVNLREVFSD